MPLVDAGLPEHLKFYDALSGEFQPVCDPNHRVHTLARLGFKALEAGQIILPDLEEGLGSNRSRGALYKPSWAPHISVIAFAETPLIEPHLTDLIIEKGNGSTLRLTDVGLEGDERRHVLVDHLHQLYYYPLGNGEEIHVARQFVSSAAASFFV